MNAALKERPKPSATKLAQAVRSLHVLHRIHEGIARANTQPLTAGELITGNVGARAACVPFNIFDDAAEGVDMLIAAHGEDHEVADDLGSPRPLWAWADDLARLEIELRPWRTALASWLKAEAEKQQAHCQLEARIEKRDGASRREREKQLQADRLQRAREAKERADRMLAEAEAAAQG